MVLNRESLIALRERSGMSKAQLARSAGIDPTLLLRIERGDRRATDAVIVKLARALVVPVPAILADPEAGAA